MDIFHSALFPTRKCEINPEDLDLVILSGVPG